MLKDTAFWSAVWHEWREHVTGPFSSRFILPLFLVSLFVTFGLHPNETGAIYCAALGGILIVGSFFYSMYSAWQKEHDEKEILQEKISSGIYKVPDWEIRDLFFYIDPDLLGKGTTNAHVKIGMMIRDAASTMGIQVFGRKKNFDGEFLPEEYISHGYWQGADFTYFFLMNDRESIENIEHSKAMAGMNADTYPTYFQLRVIKEQAVALFKKR